MSQKMPNLICYLVTSKCVANCDICISGVNTPDLPTKQAKQVIDKIYKTGAKMISFAGREPFLREDILELVKYVKTLKMKLIIETSSVTLNDEIFTTLGKLKLDWLSISIDSLDEQLSKNMGRPFLLKSHIEHIVSSCKKHGIDLKINSVVSKITKNEMNSIGQFLFDLHPKIWKLRQFTPRSSGYKVKDCYQISEEEFLRIVEQIKTTFPLLSIEGKTSIQQSGTAFMILPNGQIAKPNGKGHVLYGSALENDLAKIWNKNFTEEKKNSHQHNFQTTYK